MRKTFVFIISFLFILINGTTIKGQDSVQFGDSVIIPLKIRIGIEVAGPVIYFTDKSILNLEGYLSADLNEKISLFLGTGYSDYKYSQHNYDFLSKGIYIKVGADFNLLKPETAMGKYWAGVGVHYGLSSYFAETPLFIHENYWGKISSSLAKDTNWGHYIEICSGFRAELFRNFSVGWLISVRKLIYCGTSKDLRPIYFPGYGAGGKSFSTGLAYYIVWNIPYKKIKVALKKETPEEPEEPENTESTTNTTNSGR
jgi:hypothetical protein